MEPWAKLFASNEIVVAAVNILALIGGAMLIWRALRLLANPAKLTVGALRAALDASAKKSASDVAYFLALVASDLGFIAVGSFFVIVSLIASQSARWAVAVAAAKVIALLYMFVIVITMQHLISLCRRVRRIRVNNSPDAS